MPRKTPRSQLPTPNSQLPTPNSQLPTRLRAAREAKGLSRRRLGELLDVDQQTVYRWERGERTPSVAMLGRVAAALGVTFVVAGS